MNLSQNVLLCENSPMRVFHPYAVAAKRKGKRVYHLNIGQPDLKTPEAFFAALRNFHQDVLEYCPSQGIPELIEAVRKYYVNLGASFEYEDILITTGASEGLLFLMQAILDAGSEVITPEPFYPNYETCALIAGGALRPITTKPENGYRYASREQIEPLINKKTRAIMLANPSNPTGYVLSPEEMRVLADIAIENDLYLIADEVYREFAYGDRIPESFSKFKDLEQHLVLVDSASKRFSACGARIGALLTKNKALMAQMMKLAQCRLSVATLDQVATTALYDLEPGYFDEVREEYHRRRDVCYQKLSAIPGVSCKCPEGAFYMMAKLPVDDTEEFQKWLLEEFEDNGETVMFAPGIGFYTTPGCGHQEIRIAYVLECHKLERAMDLLAIAIEQYNNR